MTKKTYTTFLHLRFIMCIYDKWRRGLYIVLRPHQPLQNYWIRHWLMVSLFWGCCAVCQNWIEIHRRVSINYKKGNVCGLGKYIVRLRQSSSATYGVPGTGLWAFNPRGKTEMPPLHFSIFFWIFYPKSLKLLHNNNFDSDRQRGSQLLYGSDILGAEKRRGAGGDPVS